MTIADTPSIPDSVLSMLADLRQTATDAPLDAGRLMERMADIMESAAVTIHGEICSRTNDPRTARAAADSIGALHVVCNGMLFLLEQHTAATGAAADRMAAVRVTDTRDHIEGLSIQAHIIRQDAEDRRR